MRGYEEFHLKCSNFIDSMSENLQYRTNNVLLVIPTYNQKNVTLNMIKHLSKQTLVPDILIVDNASEDETFYAILSLIQNHPYVKVVRLKENYGSSGAHYIGGFYSVSMEYDYTIFSDNDAYPLDEDLIEKLVQKTEKYGVTVPKIYLGNFSNNLVCLKNRDNKGKSLCYSTFHYVSVKNRILKKAGLPIFYLVYKNEDVEFTARIFKANKGIHQVDKRYIHPTKPFRKPHLIYYNLRNYIIVHKCHQFITQLGPKSVLATFLAWGLDSASWTLLTGDTSYIKAYIYGILDGIKGKSFEAKYNFLVKKIGKKYKQINFQDLIKEKPNLSIYCKDEEFLSKLGIRTPIIATWKNIANKSKQNRTRQLTKESNSILLIHIPDPQDSLHLLKFKRIYWLELHEDSLDTLLKYIKNKASTKDNILSLKAGCMVNNWRRIKKYLALPLIILSIVIPTTVIGVGGFYISPTCDKLKNLEDPCKFRVRDEKDERS